MGVLSTEIKFYKPLASDGGDINTSSEIINGVLHALIPATSATESETGITKYFKFYIKNTNATDIANDLCLGLSKTTLGGDSLELGLATSNSSTTGTENFDVMRFRGVALATGELNRTTKIIPISFENPTRATDIFQTGDKVTFFSSSTGGKLASATIASATATELTINEAIPEAIVLNGTYVSTVLSFGNLAPTGYIGIWLKQVVPAYTIEQLANTSRLTAYFDPV